MWDEMGVWCPVDPQPVEDPSELEKYLIWSDSATDTENGRLDIYLITMQGMLIEEQQLLAMVGAYSHCACTRDCCGHWNVTKAEKSGEKLMVWSSQNI